MVREVRQPSLAPTPSSSAVLPSFSPPSKSRSSSAKTGTARPALTERTRHNNSTVSPVATRGALVADPPKRQQQQARVIDVDHPTTTTSSPASATPRTLPRRLTALAAMASPAGTRRKGARSLRGPDMTTTNFGRGADETTMLMDVAPPSDLASSSLFGDDDDDEDGDTAFNLPGPSTRPATNPPARRNGTSGRGLRGSGDLLTPQNSQQIALSQSQSQSQRGSRAKAPAARPPPSPRSSQVLPSQTTRRSPKNARGNDTVVEYDTPLRGDDEGPRKKPRPNGAAATRLTQSQQASGSRAMQPTISTPTDTTRKRTATRTPATVHAASQRLRDATPMNRRSATPMSITPSRQMLKQTREWRASLEPQLASRIPNTMYIGRLDEAIQPEPGADPLMLLEDERAVEMTRLSRSASASTAKKARTTLSTKGKGKQRASLPELDEVDAEDTFAAHKVRRDNSKAAATARRHLAPAAAEPEPIIAGEELDAPANPDSPFVPQRLRSPMREDPEPPLSRLRRFVGSQDTPSTRSDGTRTVPSSPPREPTPQLFENEYPEFDPTDFAPDMPSDDGMSMDLAMAVANAPSSPPAPELSLRRMAASRTPPYRAARQASPTPTARRATIAEVPNGEEAGTTAGPSRDTSPSLSRRARSSLPAQSPAGRQRLDSVELPTPHRSLVATGRRGPSDDEAAAWRASQRESLSAEHGSGASLAAQSERHSATPPVEPVEPQEAAVAVAQTEVVAVVHADIEEEIDPEGDTLVLAELSDDDVPMADAEPRTLLPQDEVDEDRAPPTPRKNVDEAEKENAPPTPATRVENAEEAELEDVDPEGDTLVLAQLSDDDVPMADAQPPLVPDEADGEDAPPTPKAVPLPIVTPEAELDDIDPEGDTMLVDEDEEMDMEMTSPVRPVERSSSPMDANIHAPLSRPPAAVSSPVPSERIVATPSRSRSRTPVPATAVAPASSVAATPRVVIPVAQTPLSPAPAVALSPLRERHTPSAPDGSHFITSWRRSVSVAQEQEVYTSSIRPSTHANHNTSPPRERSASITQHQAPSSPGASLLEREHHSDEEEDPEVEAEAEAAALATEDAEDEEEAESLIPAVQPAEPAVAEDHEQELDAGASTASDLDDGESDKDESVAGKDDEREEPTRSPFADVVKAALGAGMVIDPGLAQEEEIEETEMPNGEPPASSAPASKEPSPEPELDPEFEVVPTRRRRRMFAGSTPARPRTSGASQMSAPDDEPMSPTKSASQIHASPASPWQEPGRELRRSGRTSVSGPSFVPQARDSVALESPVRRSPRLTKSALPTATLAGSPLAKSAQSSPAKRGRPLKDHTTEEAAPSPARVLSFYDEPEGTAVPGPLRTTTPLMSPPSLKTDIAALAPSSPGPTAIAHAPTSSPVAADPSSSVRDRTPRSMDHESSRSSTFSPTTPPEAPVPEKDVPLVAHQSFTAFTVEVPEVAAKSLVDVATSKMPPSPRSLERTASAEGAATAQEAKTNGRMDVETESDDELDFGADDTMDAEDDAWDLTAANITQVGEDTFAAHRFAGADWEVTRIERTAAVSLERMSRSVSVTDTPPPAAHSSVHSTPMSRISSAPADTSPRRTPQARVSTPSAHATPVAAVQAATPAPAVQSTTPAPIAQSTTPANTPRAPPPMFSTTPNYAPPRSPVIRVTPAPEDNAEDTVVAPALPSPAVAVEQQEMDEEAEDEMDVDEDTHVEPSRQARRNHERVEFEFREDDQEMVILPLREGGYFKREPDDEQNGGVSIPQGTRSPTPGGERMSRVARSPTPRREASLAPSPASPGTHLAVPSPARRSRSATPEDPVSPRSSPRPVASPRERSRSRSVSPPVRSRSATPAAPRRRSRSPSAERVASPMHPTPEQASNAYEAPAPPPPPPMPKADWHSIPYRERLGLPINLGESSSSASGTSFRSTPNTSRISHLSELESALARRRQQSTRPAVPSGLSRQFVPSEPSPQRFMEHVSMADYEPEEHQPGFTPVVQISSDNPLVALQTAEILKKEYGYIEQGRIVPGADSTRGGSVQSTPYRGHNSTYYDDPNLSLRDVLYDERLAMAERTQRSISVETRRTEYDSPLRIPGAYHVTPQPRHKSHTSRASGDAASRVWTASDWRRLQRLYDAEIARTAGASWTPFKRGARAPLDAARIVDDFVAQQQLEERELVGAFERENLLTRVAAMHRKADHRKRVREEREARSSTKRRRLDEAPPSTIKRVFNWILGRPEAQQLAVPTAASAARSPSPQPRHHDDDPERGFLRRVKENFDIGEVTMAQTPSRPVSYAPERQTRSGRRRRSPSAPPILESRERPHRLGSESRPHRLGSESPEPTQLEEMAYSYGVNSAPAAPHAPLYPPLPARAAALTQSINPVRLVEGSPRPAARVRSTSGLSAPLSESTSAPAPDPLDPLRRSGRPASVATARGAWEAHAALDVSFESARREREKSSLANLRRVKSEIDRVRAQGLDVSDESFASFRSFNEELGASVRGLNRSTGSSASH